MQELSDSDDDDLVIGDGNLAKERKTSFTALKARFDSINQGTNRPVLETCDGLSGQHVDQICEPGNALASFSEDESECSRKRRVTIDLSQSSEDDELPGLSDVRKKRNIRGTCTESSENVIIVNDDGRLFSGKNVRFSGTARLKNCVSGDASDTGYYISSGESDGDMPCMLPSVLRGTSTNTSAIYSSKSASSEETSEGFRAEPVPKKKRRSPEEVALARQNALVNTLQAFKFSHWLYVFRIVLGVVCILAMQWNPVTIRPPLSGQKRYLYLSIFSDKMSRHLNERDDKSGRVTTNGRNNGASILFSSLLREERDSARRVGDLLFFLGLCWLGKPT